MRRNRIENDPLERLFAAARNERVRDEGFTRRVVDRLGPLPPSKNLDRVPTFATAFASVLLLVGAMLWKPDDFKGLTGWWNGFRQGTSIRLFPTEWGLSSNAAANKGVSSAGSLSGEIKFR